MRSDTTEKTLLSLKNEAVFYFGLQSNLFAAISCGLLFVTISLQLRISFSHYLHLQAGWLAFFSTTFPNFSEASIIVEKTHRHPTYFQRLVAVLDFDI